MQNQNFCGQNGYNHPNIAQVQAANFQQAIEYGRIMAANVLNSQKEISRQNEKIQKLEQENQKLKDGIYGKDMQLLEMPQDKIMMLFRKEKYYPFLEAVINSVKTFEIGLHHNNLLTYVVTFETKVKSGIEICFSETDLQSPKIFFDKLEKAGLYVITSFSKPDKLELLRRLIYSKKDNNIAFVPYKAGWYEKKYWYAKVDGIRQISDYEVVNPYLQRYFSLADNKSIWNVSEQIANIFNNSDVLLLFAITAGALAYTPLKNAGYQPHTLFIMDSNRVETSSAIKLMQHWTKKFYVKLSEPKKLMKSLADYKDEVAVLMDGNTDYVLKASQDINNIIRNGELITDDGFEEFNAVPVLVTTRSKKWNKSYSKTLILPSPACNIPEECIQILWKSFCDMFSSEYDYWTKRIGKIKRKDLHIEKYYQEFCWIMEAYQIFYHYLDRKRILKKYPVMSIRHFEDYVSDWLLDIEYADYLNLSEIFITWLKDAKKKGLIKLVKPCDYSIVEESVLIVAVDEDYLYISSGVMEKCVNESLSGKDVKEVYSALVEDEYAKGENDDHLYPKVPQKAGFEKRMRMAHIKRDLLLSDTELLLEVI